MRPRIADILTIASRLTEVPVADLVGRRRWLHLCAIRYPVYATARDWGYSLTAIGRMVNRDHSSIIHSLNTRERFDSYIVGFDEFCEQVARHADELPPFVAESDWKPEAKFHVYMSNEARQERERVSRRLVAARKAKIAERLGLKASEVEDTDIAVLDAVERADAARAAVMTKNSASFADALRAAA